MNETIQLLGAAPHMLTALREIVNLAQPGKSPSSVQYAAIRDVANAAIAKATVHIDELVEDKYRCPTCDENRLDWLTWIEGDTVRCQACNWEYKTQEEEV